MTLNDLLNDLYADLNQSTNPGTAVTDRYKRKINQRYRRLLSLPGVAQLRDDFITFQTVANQYVYALPPSVGRIRYLYDQTTNQRKLTQRTQSWLRTIDPRAALTPGTPEAWILLGLQQVQQQPAAPTALWIRSTSASDNATKTAAIESTQAGGYTVQTTVALNGTTAVQVGTSATHIAVSKCELSVPSVGAVTLETAASGGTVLATIGPTQTFARYLGIQLWPTPAAGLTLSADYQRVLADLVQPYDEPFLPLDFHYLLAVGARLDLYEKQDDDRRLQLVADWEMGVRRLISHVSNSPDLVIIPGSISPRWSSLGPMFPVGS